MTRRRVFPSRRLERCARWMRLFLVGAVGAWIPGCVFIQADLNPFRTRPEPLVERRLEGSGKQKVLLIDVSRVIVSAERPGLLGSPRPSLLARVREELKRAEKDDRVRAVVVRINSPGGTVTASDTLYRELREFRTKTGRPMIAHLLDVGTSGAYYVALAADEIVASPTTVTGSIGVVLAGINMSGLMDKLGVKNQTLKSGALKDAGSPLRPMTSEDEAVLQRILTAMHERFLALVQERRPAITGESLQTIRDGRVLYAEEARALGLVDRIGYLDDAIRRARELANLEEATVVVYQRPSQQAENIYSPASLWSVLAELFLGEVGAVSMGPQFWYLWMPGQARFGAVEENP